VLKDVVATAPVPQHLPGYLPRREMGDLPIVIEDTTPQEIQFNILPDRPITETVKPKEYRVWRRYVEAEFSRE
jgi:hypothetical protein